MNRLRKFAGLIALCGMTAFLTGCGDDDSTVVVTPNPPPNPPAANSPASLQSQNYNLVAAETRTISFSTVGNNYTITFSGGVVAPEAGTYTAVRSGDTWTVNTVDTAGNLATLSLNFSSAGVGTYTYTPASGVPATGSFQITSGGSTDGGATDGGATDGGATDGGATDGGATDGGATDGGATDGGATDGGATDGGATDGGVTDGGATDGGATDGGATTGTAPAAITAITINSDAGSVSGVSQNNVQLSGGGSGTFTGSDGLSGTYVYTVTGTSTASLRLDYGGQFVGDFDDMNLNFATSAFSGTQTYNGNNGPMSGTFTNVQ